MRPDGRDITSLWDIVKAGRLIESFIQGKDWPHFEQTPMCHYAVISQLEIIGEATKRLSKPFRTAHPAIPWKDIAGMRDILIHLYNKVDLAEVWKAATEDVPELLACIEPLLPPERNEEA